ncbi:methyltransferase [Photorhabdus luminescens]|uniref:Methylase n=1 Tax=Photorhabdus luminescens subsp. mexicana TaxID=2100167 RepID=A0A4V2X4T3_PHOLU|nr:methyltransferase [Photorhabdus luminescens]TDB45595.1 methylase [Photorhabdus luminescens subsp. mexicana]
MSKYREAVVEELLERHESVVQNITFSLNGMTWDLMPGVYAPHLTGGALLYPDWLQFNQETRFCEIGCGMGYLSVLVALTGCKHVLATDISSVAVENTLSNVKRHGVQEQVEVIQSNLFNEIETGRQFDIIFWNSSFVDGIAQRPESELNSAIYDYGYETHKRFLTEAFNYLAPMGKVLLGFTDLGDINKLCREAERLNRHISILRAAYVDTKLGGLTYQLLEITKRLKEN